MLKIVCLLLAIAATAFAQVGGEPKFIPVQKMMENHAAQDERETEPIPVPVLNEKTASEDDGPHEIPVKTILKMKMDAGLLPAFEAKDEGIDDDGPHEIPVAIRMMKMDPGYMPDIVPAASDDDDGPHEIPVAMRMMKMDPGSMPDIVPAAGDDDIVPA